MPGFQPLLAPTMWSVAETVPNIRRNKHTGRSRPGVETNIVGGGLVTLYLPFWGSGKAVVVQDKMATR